MKLIILIAASTMLAGTAFAQDITTDNTVAEVFALTSAQEKDPLAPVDSDEVVEEEKVLVKKIDQDGNETEEEVEAAQVERMKSDCPGRIFKTRVESTDDEGNKSAQDVTLCSDSATDDAWIEFLNNAKRQIALNDNIPVDAKDQLRAALDEEIRKTLTANDG